MAVISSRDKEIDDVSFITTLAVPTIRGYLYALSLNQQGKAYIAPFPLETDKLDLCDGKLYGADGREIPTMEINVTISDVKRLDIPLLLIMHTVWWGKFEQTGFTEAPSQIKMYIPDLIRLMGVKANQNKFNREVVIRNIEAFHKTIGCVRECYGDKTYETRFPVLIYREFDQRKNVLTVESPYLEYVVKKIYEESKDISSKEKGTKKAARKEKLMPTHSYLVKSSIASERSKMAVANVINIVTLIERAGGHGAHIKASTLVARNPLLETTLMETKATGNRNNILRRVFVKTWELLQTQTLLFDKYKNVQIPNIIPTYQTLSSTVLTFRHDGKEVPDNSTKGENIDGGADIKTVGEL